MTDNELINQIITRKQNGIDCTEQESAELKGFIRERKFNLPDDVRLMGQIYDLFPIECSECLTD